MDNNLNETEIILNQDSVEQSVGVSAEPSVVRGVDGFSPIAKVTQEPDGARITITDINGTTTAIAKNGERGIQGERGERGEQGEREEQYALILYTTLSDAEEILPLSSDIDGGDTTAKLIGVSVDDFLQYLEVVTTGERADLPNLKVHVFDSGSDMDAITVGDASIAYRYTGEEDPETGDPLFHYFISFAAYSSADEIYKYYQGEVKLDNDEWCIGLKEVPFGYPNIDNEEF